jgi:dTDP-L-rhamnose 4-epimerase
MMLHLGGWQVPIQITGSYRVGDIRHARADMQQSARALGMNTPTSLETGLRHWLKWASREGHRDITDVAMDQLVDRGLYRQARDL